MTTYRPKIPLMDKKHVKLSDQIRQAIDDSGLSRYAICKVIGLDQSTLSRFMSAEAGLSVTTLDTLADLLKLDIVVRGKPARIPKNKPGRKPKTR